MYNTESDFKQAVVNLLKKEGCCVTCVETGRTGVGVPDLFVQSGKNVDWWIELKNEKDVSVNDTQFKIHWRPGQQGWYNIYALYHRNDDVFRYVVTLVACKDGVLLIPNNINYDHNTVDTAYCVKVQEYKRLSKVIAFMSQDMNPKRSLTVRGMLVDLVNDTFGTEFDWDPDIIGLDLDELTFKTWHKMKAFICEKLIELL